MTSFLVQEPVYVLQTELVVYFGGSAKLCSRECGVQCKSQFYFL